MDLHVISGNVGNEGAFAFSEMSTFGCLRYIA